jgi:hypothetical protein
MNVTVLTRIHGTGEDTLWIGCIRAEGAARNQ